MLSTNQLMVMVLGIMAPQDAYIPIPKPAIMLGCNGEEQCPGPPKWPDVSTRTLKSQRGGQKRRVRGRHQQGRMTRKMQCHCL
jgi:hypothetical protein